MQKWGCKSFSHMSKSCSDSPIWHNYAKLCTLPFAGLPYVAPPLTFLVCVHNKCSFLRVPCMRNKLVTKWKQSIAAYWSKKKCYLMYIVCFTAKSLMFLPISFNNFFDHSNLRTSPHKAVEVGPLIIISYYWFPKSNISQRRSRATLWLL